MTTGTAPPATPTTTSTTQTSTPIQQLCCQSVFSELPSSQATESRATQLSEPKPELSSASTLSASCVKLITRSARSACLLRSELPTSHTLSPLPKSPAGPTPTTQPTSLLSTASTRPTLLSSSSRVVHRLPDQHAQPASRTTCLVTPVRQTTTSEHSQESTNVSRPDPSQPATDQTSPSPIPRLSSLVTLPRTASGATSTASSARSAQPQATPS